MKIPKVILITGANGQAAVHLAAKLLEKKCKLLLIAHDRTDRIERIVEQNRSNCWLSKCNLVDYTAVSPTVQTLIKDCGQAPQALVHMAAVRSYDAEPMANSNPEIWKGVFYSNISMAYNVVRRVLPLMQHLNQGKIVLFGSNVTRTGLPYGSAYAAAKAALANLVRSVAFETAQYNVQVNMVSPAPLNTLLEEDYSGTYLEFRKKYFESYKHSHPAHKLVELSDITQMVLSLIDLEQNSISGEEIFLTGGVL
jgi:NAD(P)-dependent dehydrogenase (short-subunit alcohol dehydrogenase family)